MAVIFCVASVTAALSAAGRSAYGPTCTVKGLSFVAVAFAPTLFAVAAASSALVNGPIVSTKRCFDVADDLMPVPRSLAARRLASAGMPDTTWGPPAQP